MKTSRTLDQPQQCSMSIAHGTLNTQNSRTQSEIGTGKRKVEVQERAESQKIREGLKSTRERSLASLDGGVTSRVNALRLDKKLPVMESWPEDTGKGTGIERAEEAGQKKDSGVSEELEKELITLGETLRQQLRTGRQRADGAAQRVALSWETAKEEAL